MATPPDPEQATRNLLDRHIGELDAAETAQAKGALQAMGLDAIADVLDYNRTRSVQELIDLYNSGGRAQIEREPVHTPKRRRIVRTTAPAAAVAATAHQTACYEPGQMLDAMPQFVQRDTGTTYERIAAQCLAHPGTPVVMRMVTGDNPRKNLDLAQRTALRVNKRASSIWRPETGSYTATAGIPKDNTKVALVIVTYTIEGGSK